MGRKKPSTYGHGRKPPPVPKYPNTGSSSTGSRAMVWASLAIFTPPAVAFLAAVGYVIRGAM
jgi:hypothetical protein